MTGPPTPAIRSSRGRAGGSWPALISLALIVIGQLLLEGRHLIGLVPAIAAAVVWARRDVRFGAARIPTAVLVVAAVLAGGAHLWGLGSFPPGLFFDEAVNIKEGAELVRPLRLQTWSHELSGRPTLFLYACGFVYHLFDQYWMATRHLVTAVNLLTVAAMAWALAPAVGRRAAAICAVVFGVSAYHLLFSRIVYEASVSTLLLMLAAGSALRAVRHGGFRWWAAWGVSLGFGLWTYNAFRLAPVFFVLALLVWAVSAPVRVRPAVARLAVGVGIALLIASPLVAVVVRNFEDFTFRAAELSVVDEARAAGSWDPLRHNLTTYPLMFVTNPGTSNQIYHWPAFSPPAAVLLWVGVGVAAGAAWRRRGVELLLLFWMVAGLVPGALTLSIEAPHWSRTLYALPAAAALAALGLVAVADLAGRRWRGPLAGTVLLFVIAGELWAFDRRIAASYDVYNFFYPRVSQAGMLARERAGQGFAVQASDEFATEAYEEVVFWTIVGGRRDRVAPVRIWESFPSDGCLEPVSMLVALRDVRLVDLVRDLYPASRLTVYRDPHDRPIIRELEIACGRPPPEGSHRSLLVRRTGTYTARVPDRVELQIEGVAAADGDRLFIPSGVWTVECRPSCEDSGVVLSGPEDVVLAAALVAASSPGHGLIGHYRNHDGSTHLQLDRLVFPNQRARLQPSFEIEWHGRLVTPRSGTYEFEVQADDFGELVVDGRSVLRYPHDEGFYHGFATLDLDAGGHPLRIGFERRRGGLTFDLTWKPPWEKDFVTIDPAYLLPSERPRIVAISD